MWGWKYGMGGLSVQNYKFCDVPSGITNAAQQVLMVDIFVMKT